MLPRAFHPTLRRFVPAAALAGGVTLIGLAPCGDGDIWWHLAAGREMVARGAVLHTDIFSVSAAGRPWVDVHWLFQLATFAVYRSFGLAGLVWAKCAVLGVAAVLLGGALGRRGRAVGAHVWLTTLLLTALFCARSLLLLRPVIVTLLFLALFLGVLEQSRRRGKLVWLVTLPLLQVAWANFQGLSALGPAVVAAYVVAAAALAARRGKAWPFAPEAAPSVPATKHLGALSLAFLGCVLACGITPFGLRAFALPFKLALRLTPGSENVYASSIAENVPPYVLEQLTSGEFWHLKYFLAVLALAMLSAGRRLRLSHAGLLLGFTALALSSNRNVLLLYWVGSPIAALYLASGLRRWLRAWRGASLRAVPALLHGAVWCAVLATASVAAARETTLAQPAPSGLPSRACGA